MKTDFLLNGTHRFIDKHPSTTLLDLIREEFNLQSVHPGCRKGHCGTCTVLLDNHLTASCLVPIFHLKGRRVETVEYLMESPEFRDIELGFLKAGFHPCKFCAGIKVLTAEAILREWEHPKESEMALFVTKNWCACTSPSSFFSAVTASSEFRERRAHAHRR
jgi:aerobic-type carbon monoxide dehydrogenase small subunit (CoxS/CutS family)